MSMSLQKQQKTIYAKQSKTFNQYDYSQEGRFDNYMDEINRFTAHLKRISKVLVEIYIFNICIFFILKVEHIF